MAGEADGDRPGLADADPARRAELKRVAAINTPVAVAALAGVTAGLLRGARTAADRAKFSDVLIAFGPSVVPTVLNAVWATRSVPATVALADVLAKVDPALSARDRARS